MKKREFQIQTVETPADIQIAREFVRASYRIHGADTAKLELPERSTSFIIRRADRILGVTSILDGSDYLQADSYYPALIESYLPDGTRREQLIEIARTATDGGSGKRYLFFLALMQLVQDYAARAGATHWLAMMKEPLVHMFRDHGWPLRILPIQHRLAGPDDPMFLYLSEPPAVKLVLSPVAGSIEVANRLRGRKP